MYLQRLDNYLHLPGVDYCTTENSKVRVQILILCLSPKV